MGDLRIILFRVSKYILEEILNTGVALSRLAYFLQDGPLDFDRVKTHLNSFLGNLRLHDICH